MTALISLSESDRRYVWFATSGLFGWVADFLRDRVDDPDVREQMRRDALSGYLFLSGLPEPARSQALRALRLDLVAAVDTRLYPRPLDTVRRNEPLFAARAKTLAVMARDLARDQAADPAPRTVVVSDEFEWTLRHGLYEWTVGFLRDRVADPAARGRLERALADRRDRLDLRALPQPGRAEALRLLCEEAVPAAVRTAAPDGDPDRFRWAVAEVRTLALMAAAAV